jgi:hypothetical protein
MRISHGVIERSSTARWLVTQASPYRASRACTSLKNGRKNGEASFNWLRTARRVTGYKLIASRLLELPQRQLISKPIKSNSEPVFPVTIATGRPSRLETRRKQSRMIGRRCHNTHEFFSPSCKIICMISLDAKVTQNLNPLPCELITRERK